MVARQLAVLGSPIGHSKSPALHRAAYSVLGLDWEFSAVEVTEAGLADYVTSRDESWRGLSLTMPLKRDVLPLLDHSSDLVELTGVANTVLLDGGQRHGFNTDVFGIAESLHSNGVENVRSGVVIGGGATAASAIVALRLLGAEKVDILVRDAVKASPLATLAERLGVASSLGLLGSVVSDLPEVEVIVSTLPGGAEHGTSFESSIRERATLLDVAYSPWPTEFAAAWGEAGGNVVHGLEMLLFQALAQVRVFVNGDPHSELPNEEAVVAAMRGAVGL